MSRASDEGKKKGCHGERSDGRVLSWVRIVLGRGGKGSVGEANEGETMGCKVLGREL